MNTATQPPAFATCDLCDAHEADTSGAFRVLPPMFHDFGVARPFCGPVHTLRSLEDNSRVRDAVNSPGEGRVLVVDGGGSLRRALVGGNLAVAAAKVDARELSPEMPTMGIQRFRTEPGV